MAWNDHLRFVVEGPLRRRTALASGVLLVALGGAVAAACTEPEEGNRTPRGGATGGNGANGDNGISLPENGVGPDLGNGVGVVGANPHAFPSAAVYDDGVSEADIAAFTAAEPDQFSPGVCVYEPHLSDANGGGALYPMNWLRPRFRWTGSGGETLWEIRLSAASQQNDFKVYTRDTQWIMPRDLWEAIASGVQDDITVTVRGQGPSGLVGMKGDFRITPALAGGSMVFWGTSTSVVESGSSRLFGFTMGDEAVGEVLRAEDIPITDIMKGDGRDRRGETTGSVVDGIPAGRPQCVGCHVSTPDGSTMAFTDNYPWNMTIASIEPETRGNVPSYVSAGGQAIMKMPFLGTAAMLPEPWEQGDRTLLSTMGRRSNYIYVNYDDKPEPLLHDLIWIDLGANVSIPNMIPPATDACAQTSPWPDECYSGWDRDVAAQERETAYLAARNTGWGVLYTDPAGSISNPVASHHGTRLAYNVSESSVDGHPDWHNNTSDIRILELNGPRQTAGAAVSLEGASSPNFLEYYPAFSSDDAFIAFNRAPAPTNTNRCRQGVDGCVNSPAGLGDNPDGPYYNRKGEIFVVPSSGGEPHRLRANDPVACSGEVSPGVINSWPKWSSTVREYEGKRYYFIIFSSARAYEGQFNLMPTGYTPPIDTRSSHLYMGVLEQDMETGQLVSYAPVYLWNQNYLATGPDSYEALHTANLTPAWEDFTIPSVPPVVVVR